MTQDQRIKLTDWLYHNLQSSTQINIDVIVDHVDRYYCPSPGETKINPIDPEIIEQIETVLSQKETNVELAHRRDLIDLLYIHYLAGRNGEGEAVAIDFAEWMRINGYFINGSDKWENDDMDDDKMYTSTDLYQLFPGKVSKEVGEINKPSYEALEDLWRDIDLIIDFADFNKEQKYDQINKKIIQFNKKL